VRVFARFLDPNEYEIMLEGLAAESRIRNRIAELKEYRRAGIHTISEGEVYDAEKRRRAAEMARLRALGAPHAKGQGARANKYLSRDGMFLPAAGASAADGPKELLKLQQGAGAGGAGASSRKKAPLPMNLTTLPGIELLSKREREVCTNCRLLPVHYLSIKEALMRASAEGETLKRADVRHMFRVEPVKAIRVYELLLQNGWIKGQGADAKEAKEEGGGGE